MKIVWTDPAVEDLRSIRDHIAKDSSGFAAVFAGRVIEAVESLSNFPMRGRKVPEMGHDDIRELLYSGYRIIYRVEQERILILAIIHGARNLASAPPLQE